MIEDQEEFIITFKDKQGDLTLHYSGQKYYMFEVESKLRKSAIFRIGMRNS